MRSGDDGEPVRAHLLIYVIHFGPLNNGMKSAVIQASKGERDHLKSWLDLKIRTGRYSALFVNELALHLANRTTNIYVVLDEIAFLEGMEPNRGSQAKPASLFIRDPLKGLWHKHYIQASFIVKNLKNYWNEQRLDVLCTSAIAASATIDELSKLIADEYVNAYWTKSQQSKLTGEFIVYAEHDGIKHYLTLGVHGDYAGIAARVASCADEFPGLNLIRYRRETQVTP